MTEEVVYPAKTGLEQATASQIEARFTPMAEAMTRLEVEYNQVIKLAPSAHTCKVAKELRLRYRGIRGEVDNAHKKLKDFYLTGGRFVDGLKNYHRFAAQDNEAALKLIEDHYKNMEAEAQQALQDKRAKQYSKYSDFVPENLWDMLDDVFDNMLLGAKHAFEAKMKAELDAEQARKKAEEAERAEQLRIREENKALKAEAEQARKKAEEEEKKHEEQLEIERAAKQKLENEVRAKQKAEQEAEDKKAKEKQEAKQAPDRQKIIALINEIKAINIPDMKTSDCAAISSGIAVLLDKVIVFAETKIAEL